MSNYPTKKLGEICDILIGGTPRRGVYKYWNGGNLPWVSIADLTKSSKEIIDTKEKITKIGVDESNAKLIPKGTLLFSFKLSIGKLAFAGTDLYTNEAIAGLTIKDKKVLDKNFLYYFLKQIIHDNLTKAVKGNTLNKEKIKNIQIPIPPLEIQKKIVERIEKLMAKIDEAKKLRKEAMTDASSLIPSALNKIFEEGKKKGWEEKTIGDLCIINPRADIKNLPKDMEISFVPMKAVDEKDGIITIRETRKLSEVSKGYTYFANNDVLFAKITPCMENGKSVIARDLKNGIGFGSTEFHVLRTKGEILPELIHYHLRQKSFREEARKRMTGSAGQKRVPKDFLEKSKIILPSLPEQQKIVKYLDSLSEKVRKIQNLQSETEMELKLLEKAVLNNAFVV